MKKILFSLFVGLLASVHMFAGHHFESDLAKKHPQLDITDIYVFKAPNADKTVFIMAFNPKSHKDSLNNYATNGIYRFSIAGDANFSKGFSPTFTFKNGKMQFYIANTAEPALGELGKLIGEGPIDKMLKFSNGIDVWTGTAGDLFYGNAAGIAAFKNKMDAGVFDLTTFDVGQNGNVFKNLQSSVIVFEIPNQYLPKNIYYYASSAIEEAPNHWHRVNRIGHVLFPHTYLLDPQQKIVYLNSNHQVQDSVKTAIYDNVLKYVTAAGIQKDPKAYTDLLVARIYPDVMTYAVGTDAEYAINVTNGRPLKADAMDVALALLIGSDTPVDDKVHIILDRYQDNFPYVVPIDSAFATDAVTIETENLDLGFTNPEMTTPPKESANNTTLWFIVGIVVVLILVGLMARRKKK